MTIPISIRVGFKNWVRLVFFAIALMRIKLLDVASEYAKSSINPNGERYRIVTGGISANSGVIVTIAANANPVDQAENRPQATPNPGINIGKEIVALWVKIPIASISSISFSNASLISDFPL